MEDKLQVNGDSSNDKLMSFLRVRDLQRFGWSLCSVTGWVSTAGVAVTGENNCTGDGEKVYMFWELLCSGLPFDHCSFLCGITASASEETGCLIPCKNPSGIEISFSRGSSLVDGRRNKCLPVCHPLSWVWLHISSPGLFADQLLKSSF